LNNYKQLINYLKNNNIDTNLITDTKTFNDFISLNNIHYLTSGLDSLKKIKDNNVDFLFSHAVFEHISIENFFRTQKEIFRIIKPDGMISHRIDLRDHIGGGLNNLRFSKKLWESDLFKNSGFYTNRIRFSEMLKIFKEIGFSIEYNIIDSWDKIPIKRKKISSDFKNFLDDDLSVKIFDVLLQKK